MKIAVAATGHSGLEDTVSEVFGRAKTFTLVDVDNHEIREVKILENPAVSYEHGAGPIVVKMLVDSGVNMVLAAELGPGASALLEQHHIIHILVKPGTGIKETISKALTETRK